MSERPVLLETRSLRKHFPVTRGFSATRSPGWVKAVNGVDLQVCEGETLGIVGESGCGKSTLARLLLLLERPTSGEILFDGESLSRLFGARLRAYRREVQAVFQDPYASLSPRMRVGDIVAEPLVAGAGATRTAARARVSEVMAQVGLDYGAHAHLYPHEFSGGQRQRIAIARALASRPRLVILDEPVSALDVSIRAQVMNLLADLQQELGLTYVLISHDLVGVAHLSNRVAVMYLGRVVEYGPAAEVFSRPAHPYTEALLAAVPRVDESADDEFVVPGEVASPINPPAGCPFHPRCRYATDECSVVEPRPLHLGSERRVSCHLYPDRGGTRSWARWNGAADTEANRTERDAAEVRLVEPDRLG